MNNGVLRACVLLAPACGGTSAAIEVPQSGPPRIHVVKCQGAVAAPRIPTREYDFEAGDTDAYGGLFGGGGGTGIGIGGGRGPLYPSVTIGTATATATIGDVSIRRFLRERNAEFRECYGAELTKDRSLRGTIVTTFVIGADGRVIGAKATGVHPTVATCVANTIGAIRFPKPPTATGMLSYPLVLTALDLAPVNRDKEPTLAGPWTPYALEGQPADQPIEGASRAAESVLRARVPELEACLARPNLTGSLRAMLELADDGSVHGVRVGGLGDLAVETCVAEVLFDLQLVVSQGVAVEIACDLSRGDAQPWRVAPAGYARIDVTKKDVRFGETVIVPHGEDPEPLSSGQTYLIVATPDAPGGLVELALVWASEGDTTLLAIADGERPLFIGEARNITSVDDSEDQTVAPHPSLVLDGDTARACLEHSEDTASIKDPAKLDAMLKRFAMACRRRECATLGIVHDQDTPLRVLAAVARATRRAGFDRVLFGAYSTCRVR